MVDQSTRSESKGTVHIDLLLKSAAAGTGCNSPMVGRFQFQDTGINPRKPGSLSNTLVLLSTSIRESKDLSKFTTTVLCLCIVSKEHQCPDTADDMCSLTCSYLPAG